MKNARIWSLDWATAFAAKFQQGEVKDYRPSFRTVLELDHVEAWVLDRVALLFPEPFAALDAFAAGHDKFVDATVARFDREVQFYLAYLEFTARLRAAGLVFCYAQVSDRPGEVTAVETFDLALAHKLAADRAAVVWNDVRTSPPPPRRNPLLLDSGQP